MSKEEQLQADVARAYAGIAKCEAEDAARKAKIKRDKRQKLKTLVMNGQTLPKCSCRPCIEALCDLADLPAANCGARMPEPARVEDVSFVED